MKNFRIQLVALLIGLVCATAISSCKKVENFLDKAPGVDLNEEKIFSSRVEVDKYLSTIYRYGLHSQLAYRIEAGLNTIGGGPAGDDMSFHPTSDMTDESDLNEVSYGASHAWNLGTVSPLNIVGSDNKYHIRWMALRQIAIFLKNVDKVPDITPAYREQIKAEVKTIRAMVYLEAVKRYGGVPIITETFAPGVKIEAPRNTVEECFNFIVQQCDEAIGSNSLPTEQEVAGPLKGRLSLLVPYAIKSRALLYAASPMFNTATPFLSMSNPSDNKLICFGNYDIKRWEIAAEAAKAALDKALASGHALVFDPTAKGRYGVYPGDYSLFTTLADGREVPDPTSPLIPLGRVPIVGNYEVSWSRHNNSEIIATYQWGRSPSNSYNDPFSFIQPSAPATGGYWSGLAVFMNHVKKYEDLSGAKVSWPETGTGFESKARTLDPRYKQSLIYNNSYFHGASPIYELSVDGALRHNSIGHWMRKMLPNNLIGPNWSSVPNIAPLDIIFRLNELYLNYAEAKNEANPSAASGDGISGYGQLSNTLAISSVYDAVNVIRARSGMPRLQRMSQAEFRASIRNERAVELAFDDHRMWDIRRWLIAEDEGVMRGRMEGIKLRRAGGSAPNYTYNWELYQHEPRVFKKSMYLNPFPLAEVQKGGILQNPGW